mmetsp:Transcript_20466/g.23190  ORF Transcript_20466/g.23190 Transcript_20466/m.23190 type:complete len:250 (+) Transcript_20466:30-779(+)
MKVLEYVLGVASVVLNDNDSVAEDTPSQFLEPGNVTANYSDDYSYYVFRLQVPGSYCQTSYCSHDIEEKLQPNGFKIHGIWPSSTGGNSPSQCRDDKFYEDDINSKTLSAMNTDWPSDRGSNDSFWSHEWSTHGVCAKDVPGYDSGYLSVDEFFTFVIDQYNKFNPTKVFSDANIKPSNDYYYNLEEINDAFKNAYGVVPANTCDYQDGKAWLMHISLCLDLDLKPMYCPDAQSSCRDSDKIYYGSLSD